MKRTEMRRTMVYGVLGALVVTTPVTAEDTERVIEREVTVDLTLDQAWNAWTTAEGLTTFFAVEADVELRVGGKYELYFDMSAEKGLRGGEGCTVLEVVPKKRLAFTWNAPPGIPVLRNANARTKMVVQFREIEPGRVHVTLKQTGIKDGENWDKYYAYFDRAWSNVVKSLDENSGKLASLDLTRKTAPIATIDDFAVFAGKWTGTSTFGPMELQWSEPGGGIMIGMFRMTDTAGKVVMLKFDMLCETEEGIEFRTRHFSPTLAAFEEKDAPLVGKLVARNGNEFVFDPAESGAMKRKWLIIESDDRFLARSRVDQDGTESFFDITFDRVK